MTRGKWPGDDSGPAPPKGEPDHAEQVATKPPITNATSRSPRGRRTADCMAAGRHESGNTPLASNVPRTAHLPRQK
jgi:hypothetical protein